MKLKYYTIKTLYLICFYSGIIQLFYFFNRKKQLILTYHNIIPGRFFDNALHLGVSHSDEVFEFQISEILKKRIITTQLGLPNSVVITFDDGYLNNYSVAYPILEKHQVSGIFFITKNNIDATEPLWIDKLMMWLSYVPKGIYTSKYLGKIIISDENSRSYQNESIWHFINNNYTLKNDIIFELDSIYSFENIKATLEQEYYNLRFTGISKEMLFTMKAHGNILGYHSIEHDILNRISIVQVDKEFKDFVEEYKGIFNSQYNSYPFGGINEINDEVLATSLKYFQCNFMNIKFEKEDMNIVSRTALPNIQNRFVLHAKLSGLEDFIKHFIR